MGSLLLDVGSRNDLSGEVKPFAKVVETLGGQGVVVVLPRELGLDVAAGVEGLKSLDNEQVLGVDIGVLGKVEVLLGDEDTLSEEVLTELLVLGCFLVHLPIRGSFSRGRELLAAAPGESVLPRGSSCGRPWESTSWRYCCSSKGSMLEGGRFRRDEGRSQIG